MNGGAEPGAGPVDEPERGEPESGRSWAAPPADAGAVPGSTDADSLVPPPPRRPAGGPPPVPGNGPSAWMSAAAAAAAPSAPPAPGAQPQVPAPPPAPQSASWPSPPGAQPWPGVQSQPGAAPWPGTTPGPASGRRSSLAALAFVAAAAAVAVPTLSILVWHLFIELPFWRVLSTITSIADALVSAAALVIGILVVRRPARIERLAGGLAIGAGGVGVLQAGTSLGLSLVFTLLF